MNYKGVVIKESLKDPKILTSLTIVATAVEPVVEGDKTPWLDFWTLVSFEVSEDRADDLARSISEGFDDKHAASWYADFKNDRRHYVVFPGKIFRVERDDPSGYAAAEAYGRGLGIPAHQLDFSAGAGTWPSLD